jgi:flavodoxin
MKILIAYYSKTGNTERVAKDLASQLGADLEKIIDKKNRSGLWGWLIAGRDGMKKKLTEIAEPVYNPVNYDLIIVGTPVWGWDMVPALRTYLEKEKTNCKNMALFATSGGTGVEKIVGSFEGLINKKMVAMVGFSTPELKDEKIYQEKMLAFINAVKQ